MANAFTLAGELRAETRSFEQSLRDSEAHLRSTEKAIGQTEQRAKSFGQTSAATARQYEKLNERLNEQRNRLHQTASAFGRGEASAKQMASALNSTDRAVKGLNSRLADSNARLTDFSNRASRLPHHLQTIGSGLQSVGLGLTVALTAPLTALGILSVKSAVTFDSLKRGLNAVSGSSEETAKQLVRLREIAKLPGLGFQEAISGSTNLQAAGLKAELAERALLGFGNALATVGKGKAQLDFVTLALTQMASKTRVSGQEIRQLSEHVPQIRQIMLAAFKTADPKELEDMGITSEKFLERLITELEKLPKVTGGFQNTFENLSDSVQIALEPLGIAIAKIIDAATPKIVEFIETFSNAFSALSPTIQTLVVAFGAILAALGPVLVVLGGFGAAVGSIASGIAAMGGLAAVATGLGIALLAVIGAVIQLGPALAIVGVQAYALYQAWQTNFGGIRDLTAEITARISALWNAAMVEVEKLTAEVTARVSEFWQENGEDIMQAVEAMSAAIKTAWQAVLAFWDAHGDAIKNVATEVWGAVRGFVLSAITAIGGAIITLAAVINGDWSKAWEGTKKILAGIGGVWVSIIAGFGALMAAALRGAFAVALNIADWVMEQAAKLGVAIILGAVNGLQSMAGTLIGSIRNLFFSAIDTARGVIREGSPSKVFFEIGTNIVRGLIIGIESFSSSALATIQKLGTDVARSFATSIESLAPDAQAAMRKLVNTKTIQAALKKELAELKKSLKELLIGNEAQISGNDKTIGFQKAISDAEQLRGVLQDLIQARVELGVHLDKPLVVKDAAKELGILTLVKEKIAEIGEGVKEFIGLGKDPIVEMMKAFSDPLAVDGLKKQADALGYTVKQMKLLLKLKGFKEVFSSITDARFGEGGPDPMQREGTDSFGRTAAQVAALKDLDSALQNLGLFVPTTLEQTMTLLADPGITTAIKDRAAALGMTAEKLQAMIVHAATPQGQAELAIAREMEGSQQRILELKERIKSANSISELEIEAAQLQKIIDLRNAETDKIIQGNVTLMDRLRLMGAQLPTFATQMKDSFAGALGGISNVLATSITQWDGTFKGFFKSVAKGFAEMALQIAQEMIRLIILQALLKIFGSVISGVTSGGTVTATTTSVNDTPVWNHAEGGLIRGPGSSKSDSIFARLSNGEFVMSAKAVKMWGAGFFARLNKLQLPKAAATEELDMFARLKDLQMPKLGLAEGGIVAGPGTSKSDSILARVSKGEFVMSAKAVKKWGAGFFAQLNNLRMPKIGLANGGLGDLLNNFQMPKMAFADGGLVQGLTPAFAGGFGGSPSTTYNNQRWNIFNINVSGAGQTPQQNMQTAKMIQREVMAGIHREQVRNK